MKTEEGSQKTMTAEGEPSAVVKGTATTDSTEGLPQRSGKWLRRDLLKIGALGATAPLIMTLAPRDARAYGSWQNQDGSDFAQRGRASGWQFGGRSSLDGIAPGLGLGEFDNEKASSRFVFPFSYEWRSRKVRREIQERWLRENYGGLGDLDK